MKPARTTATRASARTHILYTRLPIAPPPHPSDDLRRWRKAAHNATATFIPSDACIITTPSLGRFRAASAPLPPKEQQAESADEIKHRDVAVSKCTS